MWSTSRLFPNRATVYLRIVQNVLVLLLCCCCTYIAGPGTAVLVRVLQTRQVTIQRGGLTDQMVPLSAILVKVLQTRQGASRCSCDAHIIIPWTPLLVQVLQTMQVAILRSCITRINAKIAVLDLRLSTLDYVLQTVQTATPSGQGGAQMEWASLPFV